MKKINERHSPLGRISSLALGSLLILCLGLITASVSFGGTATTAASSTQTQNVNVVNSPTVQSQQSGTWNVGIAGTPTVTVGNLTANSIPVVSSPSSPFQEEVIITFNNGSNSGTASFDVPAGMLLVIEHVSASAALTTGQQITVTRLDTNLNLFQKGHYFASSFQGSVSGVGDYFAFSQDARLYSVGSVGFFASRSDTVGLSQMNISVSGYLISQ